MLLPGLTSCMKSTYMPVSLSLSQGCKCTPAPLIRKKCPLQHLNGSLPWGRGQHCKERSRMLTPSCDLNVWSFRTVCGWGSMSRGSFPQQPRQSWDTDPDKPGLQICGREGALHDTLAWSHSFADTAQSHSCQTVSVSMRPCVSES